MPHGNLIARHWKKELGVLEKNLLLLHQGLEPLAIHDTRVAIKKLRSYFRFYNRLLENKGHKHALDKIKILFSILGRHRNLEISKGLLLSLTTKDKPGTEAILIYLQVLQEQVSGFCTRAIKGYDAKELAGLTNNSDDEFENYGLAGIREKASILMESMLGTIADEQEHFRKKAHLVRKQLKDISYWSEIFGKEYFFTPSQLKLLDKILAHLGNCQDYEVLIANLGNFRKMVLANGLEEFEIVKVLEEKASKKKEKLLEKAHQLTKRFISENKKSDPNQIACAPGGS